MCSNALGLRGAVDGDEDVAQRLRGGGGIGDGGVVVRGLLRGGEGGGEGRGGGAGRGRGASQGLLFTFSSISKLHPVLHSNCSSCDLNTEIPRSLSKAAKGSEAKRS